MNQPDSEKLKQLRREIGYQRKLLGLSEELYREMLFARYKVESCKNLSEQQAKQFLKILRDQAKDAGVFKPKKQYAFQKYKHNNLADRDDDMATPAQLRKIEAIWFEVSVQTNDESREKALNSFLKRITGVENIKFLPKYQVQKVIKALYAMKSQKKVV